LKLADTLFIIPARGGSKGIPCKNIKLLGTKPLIYYSIDYARNFASDENICVTSDNDVIINKVEQYGLKVPFKRPDELATDTAGTYEVILHAINYYESVGKFFSKVILLQPTSPIREIKHLSDALSLYNDDLEMVVSVTESDANPYYNLFEEGESGYLKKSKESNFVRRQDCPKVFKYNGSIYIINTKALKTNSINCFTKIKKCIMENKYSIDLDTEFDWKMTEFILLGN
jgi:CMP-N,N'-diacetyllegionaminic acid synthase